QRATVAPLEFRHGRAVRRGPGVLRGRAGSGTWRVSHGPAPPPAVGSARAAEDPVDHLLAGYALGFPLGDPLVQDRLDGRPPAGELLIGEFDALDAVLGPVRRLDLVRHRHVLAGQPECEVASRVLGQYLLLRRREAVPGLLVQHQDERTGVAVADRAVGRGGTEVEDPGGAV